MDGPFTLGTQCNDDIYRTAENRNKICLINPNDDTTFNTFMNIYDHAAQNIQIQHTTWF